MKAAVGVVGLGPMGAGIAERLAACGYRVTGFDIDESVWQRISAEGIGRAASLEESAASCDSLLIVVNSDAAMLETVTRAAPGSALSTIVVMGTHSPGACQRAESLAADHDVRVVDAPVSGGRDRALAGQLSILSSGSQEALASVRELFDNLADRVFTLGPVGAGQGVKLINNLLTTVNLMAVAEAWALAEHLGLDMKQATDAVMASSGASRRLSETATRLFSGADLSGSRAGLHLLAKDLDLALACAPPSSLPLVSRTRSLVAEAVDIGLAERDIESVVPWTVARVQKAAAEARSDGPPSELL